jgi:hypothetical protein
VTYSGVTSGDVTDSGVTSGDVTYSGVTSGDVTYKDVTSGDVTDNGVTSGDVTDNGVTSGDVTYALRNFRFAPPRARWYSVPVSFQRFPPGHNAVVRDRVHHVTWPSAQVHSV